MTRRSELLMGVLVLIAPVVAYTKPIAFAQGTTVMLEYGAGTMWEAQIFYAPQYNYSVGGGHVEFDSDISSDTERVTYARLNYLLHRWNLESAQANIFVWGGAGAATGNSFSGTEFAVNAGAQADYETRRVYASLKTDLQRANAFSIEWIPSNLASHPISTTTTRSPRGSSCRRATTRGESLTASRSPHSCASLKGVLGSKPESLTAASCKPWQCSTSERSSNEPLSNPTGCPLVTDIGRGSRNHD